VISCLWSVSAAPTLCLVKGSVEIPLVVSSGSGVFRGRAAQMIVIFVVCSLWGPWGHWHNSF